MNRRLQKFLTSDRGEYCVSRFPAVIVIGLSLWYIFAFVSIYDRPHGYEVASRWIYQNVPPGSTIAGVHWDDRLPLSLPGLSAHQYQFEGEEQTLNLYEPDSPAKIAQTLKRLSNSDYLVFPTYRLPGSVPRLPNEYPWSTRFFQQLFSNKLGFQLVQTIKDRPSFLGIEWNDDLADESFSVYDHPKIAIFKNVDRLTADEIGERVSTPRLEAGLTLNQIMDLDVGEASESVVASSNTWSVLLWFGSIQVLAFASLPLTVFFCGGLADRGYGLSKTFGIFLFGVVSWWLATFDLTKFSAFAAHSIAFLVVIAGIILYRMVPGLREQCRQTVNKNFLLIEGVFLGVTLLFLTIRYFNSEIFWGEKPMDSTFLRFLTRLDTLPPEDPWAAGQRMHYYYVGISFLASLLKLTEINPAVGFNLALATLAGLIAVGVSSLTLTVTKSRGWSIVSGLSVVLVSNLETIRLVIVEGRKANFDTFWASARVFTSPAFGEYTLWSLIFGDLHAHVIAIPFTVLLVGLLTAVWLQVEDRFRWQGILLRIAVGLLFGFLYAANTWDFISFGAICGLLLLFSAYKVFWEPPSHGYSRPPMGEQLLAYGLAKGAALAWDAIIIGGAAATIMLPFARQSGSTQVIGWGWVQSFELNSLKQVLLFAGHWVLMIIVSGACIVAGNFRSAFSAKVVIFPLLCALFPWLLAAGAMWNGIHGLPWGIVFVSSILIWLGMSVALVDSRIGVIGIVAAGAGIIMVSAELLFLIDRMNTIFKSYMCVTLASAISGLILWRRASSVIREAPIFRGMTLETLCGLHLANTICLILPLFGSLINIKGVISMQRVPSRVHSLDGMAYLEKMKPNEFKAISWLNENVNGTPVTLEAHGDSYQDYTRIAMHTGLPTVLGWDHHVSQRGTPGIAIDQRKRDIRIMYSTTDVDTAERLLLEYNVDLIIVGDVEKRIYPATGLGKFEQFSERFPLLFKSGDVAVYATRHSKFNPIRGSRTRNMVER